MKKVLCIYAHPKPNSSQANRYILERLKQMPNITIHPIYEVYPEFYIDVKAEQKLLLEHDVLLLQHPFYWYSMPPLLKLWFDAVLEFNFAYGPNGKALVGKDFFLSITTGGPQSSYAPTGYNSFTIESFFPPYEQTARLCGMQWHPPLVLHHALGVAENELKQHASLVCERLGLLCKGGK